MGEGPRRSVTLSDDPVEALSPGHFEKASEPMNRFRVKYALDNIKRQKK
jgi:hypothetical protein